MKVQIEIQESNDGCVDNAVFSLSITDVPILNRGSLANLPQKIEQAYHEFYKMKTGKEIPIQLRDFIHNNLQCIG